MDSNNDGMITPPEVNAYKGDSLDLTNCNLSDDISLLKYIPENVKTLNLSDNNISEIPEGLFDELTGLKNFYIERNKLTSIPKGLFKNCKSLEWISFTGNEITTLKDGTFEGLDQLTTLDFEKNKIQKIESHAFDGMPKMKILSFEENELETMPDDCLEPFKDSLTFLNLGSNHLQVLPKAIGSCAALIELYADRNEMKDINQVDFSKLTKLEEVDFIHNEIDQIKEGLFAENANLQGLDLSDNQLTSLSPDVFAKNANLRKLDVRLNNIRVVDKKLIAKTQSHNKFYPQKSVMELTLNTDGSWSEQLSILDVMFWYDMTISARVQEIKSVEEYKEYLKEKGYADRNFLDVLNDDWSYDWDIVTKLQKKDATGKFVTISETKDSEQLDKMNGTVAFNGDGTYRIAKDMYVGSTGIKNLLFETISNEITVKKETPAATTTQTKQNTTTTNKKKAFKKIATMKKAGKVSYVNKKLKRGKTYYYKVRAYKVVSGKKVYGKFSAVKKMKIKK